MTTPDSCSSLFRITNIRGALITMPHKVTTVSLADEVTTTARIAGSANALLKRPDGTLLADMFDGTGFRADSRARASRLRGRRCLVVGAGGVGSAIAASLAAAGVASIALSDTNPASAEGLASRLRNHYPKLEVRGARSTIPPVMISSSMRRPSA